MRPPRSLHFNSSSVEPRVPADITSCLVSASRFSSVAGLSSAAPPAPGAGRKHEEDDRGYVAAVTGMLESGVAEASRPQLPVIQPPPPINLKFFGFASKPGEAKRIFLSQGEDVFIAGEGDIVNRRYRVLHISPAAVDIEDVLNNNRQSIPLTQG